MADRHVVPVEDGWQVEKDDAQRASAKTATQADAITRAAEIVAKDGGGQVLIHGADGQLRETRTVAADSASPGDAGSASPAESKAEGASRAETAPTAGSKISDDLAATGRRITGETATAARTAAATAQDAAYAGRAATSEIGERAEHTGRQVIGEARGVKDRALKIADEVDVEENLRAGVERLTTATDEARDELDTAAQRAGRRVHTLTERIAQPLDDTTAALLGQLRRASRVLNPVRVTGRAVELGVSTTLRAAASVTSGAGRVVPPALRASKTR